MLATDVETAERAAEQGAPERPLREDRGAAESSGDGRAFREHFVTS
jgi:hypothetical protein